MTRASGHCEANGQRVRVGYRARHEPLVHTALVASSGCPQQADAIDCVANAYRPNGRPDGRIIYGRDAKARAKNLGASMGADAEPDCAPGAHWARHLHVLVTLDD